MGKSVKMQKAAAIIVYVAVALALIVLIICPIVSIFARSIITDGKLDWSNLVQLFSDSEYFQTIGNSLLLGLSVTVLTTVIALPLAYIFSRTRFAKARWMDIVFMIPFMTPPYISAMGWTRFLGRNGFLHEERNAQHSFLAGRGGRRLRRQLFLSYAQNICAHAARQLCDSGNTRIYKDDR